MKSIKYFCGKVVFIVSYTGIFWLAFIQNAHAYLDLGTLNLVLQSVIAGIMGLIFMPKMIWLKVKNYFSGRKPGQGPDNP